MTHLDFSEFGPARLSKDMADRMLDEEDLRLASVEGDERAEVAREFPYAFPDDAIFLGFMSLPPIERFESWIKPEPRFVVLMNGDRFDHRPTGAVEAETLRRRVEALWPDAIVEMKEIE